MRTNQNSSYSHYSHSRGGANLLRQRWYAETEGATRAGREKILPSPETIAIWQCACVCIACKRAQMNYTDNDNKLNSMSNCRNIYSSERDIVRLCESAWNCVWIYLYVRRVCAFECVWVSPAVSEARVFVYFVCTLSTLFRKVSQPNIEMAAIETWHTHTTNNFGAESRMPTLTTITIFSVDLNVFAYYTRLNAVAVGRWTAFKFLLVNWYKRWTSLIRVFLHIENITRSAWLKSSTFLYIYHCWPEWWRRRWRTTRWCVFVSHISQSLLFAIHQQFSDCLCGSQPAQWMRNTRKQINWESLRFCQQHVTGHNGWSMHTMSVHCIHKRYAGTTLRGIIEVVATFYRLHRIVWNECVM